MRRRGRLPLPVELKGVMANRRLEVLPPLRLTVVAVRPRVREDVHAAVPNLHRQRVGVRVRGDRQEPVRPAVQSAPYFWFGVGPCSEDRDSGIRETVRPIRGPTTDLPPLA